MKEKHSNVECFKKKFISEKCILKVFISELSLEVEFLLITSETINKTNAQNIHKN